MKNINPTTSNNLVLRGSGFVDTSAIIAIVVNGWKECIDIQVLSDDFLFCSLGFGMAGVNMSVTLVTRSFAVVTSESIVTFEGPSISLVSIDYVPSIDSSLSNVFYVSDSVEILLRIEGNHFHPELSRLSPSLVSMCNHTRI